MHGLKRKSILKNYLITYMGLALAACAALGVVLMMIATKSLNEQEQSAVEARLASACDDFSYQLDVMRDLTLRLRTTHYYQPVFLAKSPYNEVLMLENFSLLSGASALADAYFILYEDTQSVFTPTTKMTVPIFAKQYAASMTREEFEEALHGDGSFLLLNNGGGENLFRKQKITFNRYSQNSSAYLLFRMDRAELAQRYGGLFRLNSELILRVDGEFLLGGQADAPAAQAVVLHEGEEILFAVRDGVGAPASMAMRSMLYILIGMSLLFAFISACLAWQNYTPIRRLANKVEHHAPDAVNEIQLIAQAVDDMVRQNSTSMRRLTASLENISRLRESLKQQILLLALSGEYDPTLSQRMADAGLDLSGEQLCMAHIADDDAFTTEEINREVDLLSDQDAKLYLARLGGRRGWALLLCARNENYLMAAYDTVSEELTARFPSLRIAQGEICGQPQKLAYSLAVAESAQGKDAESPMESARVFDILEALKKQMREGNALQAQTSLDQLLRHLDQEYPSMLFRRYRMVEITYQLLTFGRGLGCNLETEQIRNSLNRQDPDALRKMLSDLVEKICLASPRAAEQIPAASKQVMDYIAQHAADYDVCLDSVATACDISTKQVSRIARNVVGMSFKEYVSHLRMRKAMALLEAGASSTETARQVGYLDISHFTKVFRAHAGVTPGQYRDQRLQEAAPEAEVRPE